MGKWENGGLLVCVFQFARFQHVFYLHDTTVFCSILQYLPEVFAVLRGSGSTIRYLMFDITCILYVTIFALESELKQLAPFYNCQGGMLGVGKWEKGGFFCILFEYVIRFAKDQCCSRGMHDTTIFYSILQYSRNLPKRSFVPFSS